MTIGPRGRLDVIAVGNNLFSSAGQLSILAAGHPVPQLGVGVSEKNLSAIGIGPKPIFPDPFSPDDIDNLAMWLDAADASTIILNGSTVSQWDDKSGFGRHVAQPVATSQPNYVTGALGGLPVINYDQISGFQHLLNTLNIASSPATFIILSRFTAVGAVGNRLIDGNSSSNPQRMVVQIRTPGTWFSCGTGGAEVSDFAYPGPGTPYYVHHCVFSPTAGAIYIDNVLTAGPGNSGNSALSVGIIVGGGFAGFGGLVGDIAEFIIYDRIITATERTNIYNYLKTKWSLP